MSICGQNFPGHGDHQQRPNGSKTRKRPLRLGGRESGVEGRKHGKYDVEELTMARSLGHVGLDQHRT